ncbi:MAG: cyclic nucleotide-binding domain-containing protein [Anaerolineae bacterium]|jgi:ABC-type lipoprotein export system ATPase subunit/CRP-like cAMP-binding protein
MEIKCIECGSELRAGARFCTQCGTVQPSPLSRAAPTTSFVRCSRCGAVLRLGANFCSECGAQQLTAPPVEPQPEPQCINCGATLRPQAKFCPRCGTARLTRLPPTVRMRAAGSMLAPTQPTPTKPLIDLRQVVKVYKTPAGPFTALKGVDLQVGAGEFVAVIGKSGSGKTTLINTITGIDRPTLGEVLVGGVPIHTMSENEVALWRGKNLGVIFQFFQLLPTLTLIENVMLPMEFGRLYSVRERKNRALYLLNLVGLAEQAYKLPSMVSGGQQQRAAIARALANDPIVLVADEPTGSLDSKTADSIFQLFEDLVDQGKTILTVTHDQDWASRVGRVVQIADGEIVDQYIAKALDMLSQEQLVQISSHLEPETFAAGSIVFRQGDPSDRFYIVVKGQVEVAIEHASGKEVIGAILESGQFFGEAGLLQGTPRRATVRVSAGADALLMALDRETFGRLVIDSNLTHDAIAQVMRQRMTVDHLLASLPEQVNRNTSRLLQSGHERLTFQPGQVIIREGDVADKFYLITNGEVEVLQSRHGNAVVARLSSGQYFGEIGLLHAGRRTATVRAAADEDTVVEVVAISRDLFSALLTESNMTRNEIVLIMRQRLMELGNAGGK